jgi:hypothetical protein
MLVERVVKWVGTPFNLKHICSRFKEGKYEWMPWRVDMMEGTSD